MPNSDPQTILKAFEKLHTDYHKESLKVATKQEIAARKEDKELVEQASTYTPESIFQSLAQLQSGFGQSIDGLVKNITTEVEKLAQIQHSMLVEKQRLTTLHNTKVAAEAINILQQEHQQALESLDKENKHKTEALEEQISQQREIWQKQQQDHKTDVKKQQNEQATNRQVSEEEHDYKLTWQQTEDTDGYDKRKRTLELHLAEEDKTKEKDWTERLAFLDKEQAKFEEYKTKVDSIPKEIEEAVKKARESAIKDTHKDEENKAKLLDKERESKRKGFELKIESLNQTVTEQKTRITQLSEQLQAASLQIQQLAMTALSSTGQSKQATAGV